MKKYILTTMVFCMFSVQNTLAQAESQILSYENFLILYESMNRGNEYKLPPESMMTKFGLTVKEWTNPQYYYETTKIVGRNIGFDSNRYPKATGDHAWCFCLETGEMRPTLTLHIFDEADYKKFIASAEEYGLLEVLVPNDYYEEGYSDPADAFEKTIYAAQKPIKGKVTSVNYNERLQYKAIGPFVYNATEPGKIELGNGGLDHVYNAEETMSDNSDATNIANVELLDGYTNLTDVYIQGVQQYSSPNHPWINYQEVTDISKVFDGVDNYYLIGKQRDAEIDAEWHFHYFPKTKNLIVTHFEVKYGNSAFLTIPMQITFYGKAYKVNKIQLLWESSTSPYEFCLLKNIDELCERAFSHKRDLKRINIPSSVKRIGRQAFYLCENLESITIPQSVESIGDEVFFKCYNLKNVIWPASLKTIPRECFFRCKSLESFNVPDGVDSICSESFAHCESLTQFKIPASVTYIGNIFGGAYNENLTVYVDEHCKADLKPISYVHIVRMVAYEGSLTTEDGLDEYNQMVEEIKKMTILYKKLYYLYMDRADKEGVFPPTKQYEGLQDKLKKAKRWAKDHHREDLAKLCASDIKQLRKYNCSSTDMNSLRMNSSSTQETSSSPSSQKNKEAARKAVKSLFKW
ncbi:MAG: leucine-rich repeat domain-containing protein [Prevotella sp.]|nr:leucine-rich repeat domain-containing protein [Prevotella sp.]